jgi:hypothetical protein
MDSVQDELTRIPRGPLGQNILRSAYNMAREKGLSPKEALREAVAGVRKKEPEFKPNLTDPGYFEWSE